MLVVHAAHPSGDVVRLADLGDEQFVLFDRASSYHELTNAMFLEAAIAPRSVMELDNVDSAKKMVGLGLGVAFLPHVAVADEMRSGSLRLVALAERRPPRRPDHHADRLLEAGPHEGVLGGNESTKNEPVRFIPAGSRMCSRTYVSFPV